MCVIYRHKTWLGAQIWHGNVIQKKLTVTHIRNNSKFSRKIKFAAFINSVSTLYTNDLGMFRIERLKWVPFSFTSKGFI
mgnify:CR=1 FL=1